MLLKIEMLHSKHNLRARKTYRILRSISNISKLTSLQSDVKVLLLFQLSIIVSFSDVSFT